MLLGLKPRNSNPGREDDQQNQQVLLFLCSYPPMNLDGGIEDGSWRADHTWLSLFHNPEHAIR